jgi:hypothetical protein
MTKYYLTLNMNYTHINKLIKKMVNNSIINEKIILTNDGFIKKEDNAYIKYTLEEEKESEKIYLDDLECYTDHSYEKKMGEVYQIPLEHKLLHVKKYIFKSYDKSLLQFVIETNNYNVVEYYFEKKNENFKILEIKNEFISFLNDLRNILYI